MLTFPFTCDVQLHLPTYIFGGWLSEGKYVLAKFGPYRARAHLTSPHPTPLYHLWNIAFCACCKAQMQPVLSQAAH